MMFSAGNGSNSHFDIQENTGKDKVHCAWGEEWQSPKLWQSCSWYGQSWGSFVSERECKDACLEVFLVHYRGGTDHVRHLLKLLHKVIEPQNNLSTKGPLEVISPTSKVEYLQRWDPTAFLGNFFQCLTTLPLKVFFLTSSCNFSCCDLCLLPLNLPLLLLICHILQSPTYLSRVTPTCQYPSCARHSELSTVHQTWPNKCYTKGR